MWENKIQAIDHKQSNDIYKIFFKVNMQNSGNEANVSVTNLRQWHEKLGHINIGQLKIVLESGAVKGIKITNKQDFFCEACQYGKAHRLKFDKKSCANERSWKPGELVHTNVCVLFSEMSLGGAKYYLLLSNYLMLSKYYRRGNRLLYILSNTSQMCVRS